MLEYPWCRALIILAKKNLLLPRRQAWCCIIHERKHTGCKHWKPLLTQPVALNILRSKGSPESSPSILVSEWQVAMQATNAELTILSLAALDSGGEKLWQRERRSRSTACDCDRREIRLKQLHRETQCSFTDLKVLNKGFWFECQSIPCL